MITSNLLEGKMQYQLFQTLSRCPAEGMRPHVEFAFVFIY